MKRISKVSFLIFIPVLLFFIFSITTEKEECKHYNEINLIEYNSSNVTKSAFSQFRPNTTTSNTVSSGFAENGYGTVVLDGNNTTARDIAFTHYWGARFAGWPNEFQMIAVERNTNPGVATAIAKSSPNGLIVDFQAGQTKGTTQIVIGYTITSLRASADIESSEQPYNPFSGYLYYTVSNAVATDASDSNKPAKPTIDDMPTANQNGYVYVKCENYPNSDPRYNSTRTHAGFMSLKNSVDGWSFGDVYANDGRFGNDAPTSDYPWLSDLTINKEWYLDAWNRNYSSKEGTHYLADATPVKMTFVSDGYEWYYFTEDVPLIVWTTEKKEVKTYTVIYTDGISGEIVFPDQGYESLKAGDKTPVFEYIQDKTQILEDGTVIPKREGYTFMGWDPTVNPRVSADDANEHGEIIYIAKWMKNIEQLIITDFEKELVKSEKEIPNELKASLSGKIDFPKNDDKVHIPYNGRVTLLYKITITGSIGKEYEVTDNDAIYAGGDKMKGILDDSGKAVIYVTRNFSVSDIDLYGKLVNIATITPGKNDETSSSSTETIPAIEENLDEENPDNPENIENPEKADETEDENPNTGDSVITFITLGFIALIVLFITKISKVKRIK